jgi:hypothetical protein
MVDGVVVIGGSTAVVSGASGSTVSVMVSPVVASDVVTGPGVGGSAELDSVEATAKAPMATTALAPIVAETNLICFDVTSDHSNSVAGEPPQPAGWPFEQREQSTVDAPAVRVTEAVGAETPAATSRLRRRAMP